MTANASLTGTQRKYLRGIAHVLRPVVQVGKGGVNEGVIAATNRALADHELIKVKMSADRDERALMAEEIARGCHAELVGTIGTIAILYRRHPDPEKRVVVLPKKSSAGSPTEAGEPAD